MYKSKISIYHAFLVFLIITTAGGWISHTSSKNKNTRCSENQWTLQVERMYNSKISYIPSILDNYDCRRMDKPYFLQPLH